MKRRLVIALCAVATLIGATTANASAAIADEGPNVGFFSPPLTAKHPNQAIASNSPNVKTLLPSEWIGARCDPSTAYAVTPHSPTLSGWSLGRLGPIYFLAHATDDQLKEVANIIWIDPGGASDLLDGACDTQKLTTGKLLVFKTPGEILADWLAANPDAHLLVLAGPITADKDHLQDGKAHAGIQNAYFNDVRAREDAEGGDLRSRVSVCNYSAPGTEIDRTHDLMFAGAQGQLSSMPMTACPSIDQMQLESNQPWHP